MTSQQIEELTEKVGKLFWLVFKALLLVGFLAGTVISMVKFIIYEIHAAY